MSKPPLTVELLRKEAARFAATESTYPEPVLYGVTDGKAVGTYFEHKFRSYLQHAYEHSLGNAAKGIDFPDLNVDVKVTSVKQPQSSSPFRSARQKIYGLGYSLLQLALQDRLDQPFEAAMRETVLQPIGMRDSRFSQNPPEAVQTRVARGHLGVGAPVQGGWFVHPELAAAGLWSTPRDLAAFVIAVADAKRGQEGALLSRELQSIMQVKSAAVAMPPTKCSLPHSR